MLAKLLNIKPVTLYACTLDKKKRIMIAERKTSVPSLRNHGYDFLGTKRRAIMFAEMHKCKVLWSN